MLDTSAVRVSPTRAVPVMVSAPVAGRLGLASTASVAALLSDSALPASSVKLTVTLTALEAMGPTRCRTLTKPLSPALSATPAGTWPSVCWTKALA